MAGLLFPPKSAAAKATAASVPVCPAAAFSVERIEDPAQLAGLEPVWNRLLDESDVLHPFVTHEWVQTWWECYAGLARLSVLVAREGNTVRAIAPLMRARQSMLGLPVDCTLAARNDHSPRFDLIVAGRAAEAYRALWSTMAPSADQGAGRPARARRCRLRWRCALVDDAGNAPDVPGGTDPR